MATQQADKAETENQTHRHHQVEPEDGALAIDLPAPEGWTKKFYPNRGGTPGKNEIIFISPSGEEVKNKKQLDQYRKSHPGCPPPSEFDWGTGDSPRRSTRLSTKAKERETQTPQSSSSQKRQKKSSSKKTAKEENGGSDGEGKASQDEEMASTEAVEKTSGTIEVQMKDAEVDTKREETKGVPADADNKTKESDQKSEEKADAAAKESPGHVGGENPTEMEELPDNKKEEHPDGNKPEAEEKPADAQPLQETPVPDEPDTCVEQKDVKDAILSESVAGAEKEPQIKNVEEKEALKETDKSGDVGQGSNDAEENQEAAKHIENEPNAPPISC